MNKSQLTGAAIMAVAAVQMLAFGFGMMRRSYAAVALPVGAAMAGLSALALWIGWTMMTTESNMDGAEFEEEFATSNFGQES